MYLDGETQLCSAQALTSTAISENVYNAGPLSGGNLTRDLGQKGLLGVLLVVNAAFTAAGAATLDVTVESDDNAALTSATVHQTWTQIAKATLVADYSKLLWLPPGDYQQYIGLRFTIGTGPFTAGDVDAWLVMGDQGRGWKPYQTGYTTSVG